MSDAEDNKDSNTQDRICSIISTHPQLILAVVVILIVVIIVMTFYSYFGGKPKKSVEKLSNRSLDDSDSYIDELIESIHKKQKKKNNS